MAESGCFLAASWLFFRKSGCFLAASWLFFSGFGSEKVSFFISRECEFTFHAKSMEIFNQIGGKSVTKTTRNNQISQKCVAKTTIKKVRSLIYRYLPKKGPFLAISIILK